MPGWILPLIVAIILFAGSQVAFGFLATAAGLPLAHSIPHFDAQGHYQESGSTRLGFLSGLFSLAIAIWGGAAAHTKRMDGGMSPNDRRFALYFFGALSAYVAVLHLVTVTFERTTRHIPDILFNMLDLGVLVGCGYVAFRAFHRRPL